MLLVTHEAFDHHDTGAHHPERPARLGAVTRGLASAGVAEAMVPLAPRPATAEEMERIHPRPYLQALARMCERGGGMLDEDTPVSAASWRAAQLAAGAGLAAVEALDQGLADVAFLALRPPGHHATPRGGMGFCLVNNVAVTAAMLIDRGERVAIVDFDAHHGNGTQDAFWNDPRVLFASLHQWPLYPGTGALTETGGSDAAGLTVNVPFPARTTGDMYLRAFDEVIAPAMSTFSPTWVLVSAGFDAHRDDPLTELGLTAGDFADLVVRIAGCAPRRGRLALFLEGGYDLAALAGSVGATVAALVGVDYRPEGASNDGPGAAVIDDARELRRRFE
jgi:acetoin utilization deacetylase AcuC-like enzyme